VRAPRELVVAAPGVLAVAVATAAHGFLLQLIMNWFLIIQPFDRAAAKVLGRRIVPCALVLLRPVAENARTFTEI